MASTFSGLSSALSSLYAQRSALEVTSNNIANANTEGYSRQRAELAAVPNVRVPAMYSTGDPGSSGVEVTTVDRLHDEFLDARSRTERGLNQYLSGQKDTYARIEEIVNEPSNTGVQSQIADLWSSMHDVANRPNDVAARNVALSRAGAVADSLATAHSGLSSLWNASSEQLDARVNEVNTAAAAVADYNHRIALSSLSGTPTNELQDQRDQLIAQLSDLTGATSRPRMNGTVDVLISGSSLVAGEDVRKLEVAGASALAGQPGDPVVVRWADTTNAATISSGQIASSLETLNSTIPTTATGYDTIANQLATTVNTQHKLGYDLTGAPGVDLFSGTTAETLRVAITDPAKLAASSTPPTTNPDGTTAPTLDGGNADALAAIAKQPSGPDSAYRAFVTNIGVDAQTVNRRSDIQTAVSSNAQADVQAASGVSLDEEMTNMIQYQRAYEAAAKVISTIDSTLDTLVNSMKR